MPYKVKARKRNGYLQGFDPLKNLYSARGDYSLEEPVLSWAFPLWGIPLPCLDKTFGRFVPSPTLEIPHC